MRLIDADALKEKIENEVDNNVGSYCDGLLGAEILIDNAPTVEPFEPDYVGAERLKARQRGYEDGYHNGMAIGKTLNPKIKQGEWIPCSEKTPELKGFYLTSTVYGDVYCDYWNGCNFDRTEMVLAWMQLPKPFKEEGGAE